MIPVIILIFRNFLLSFNSSDLTPFCFSFATNPTPMLESHANDLDVANDLAVGGNNMVDQHNESENPYEQQNPSVEEPKSEPECDDVV